MSWYDSEDCPVCYNQNRPFFVFRRDICGVHEHSGRKIAAREDETAATIILQVR